MHEYAGFFISLEGGEGVGKTIQSKRLANLLKRRGYDVILTREPGGTPAAEAVRDLILSGYAKKYGASAEAGLFATARADHVETLILPALKEGKVVLCDRFLDSTHVYQGMVGGVDEEYLSMLDDIGTKGLRPDLTLVFDMPHEEALARAHHQSSKEGIAHDRFENEAGISHAQIRQGFLERAKADQERCEIINAEGTIDQVAKNVRDVLKKRDILPTKSKAQSTTLKSKA